MSTDAPDLHAMLVRLRAEAEQRVAELAATLEGLTTARRSESDDDEHDPEGVTLSTEWSRLSGLLSGAEESLQRVNDALERWQAGTYGVCESCGEAIPVPRLEARPFAVQCVPCAERSGR